LGAESHFTIVSHFFQEGGIARIQHLP